MHNKPETLGDIIKSAREQSDYTVEQLAEKVGISERYLYKIENEEKKPSFDILFKLIRTLSISPDDIFYPEKSNSTSKIENLLYVLSNSDRNNLILFENIIKTLIEFSQK